MLREGSGLPMRDRLIWINSLGAPASLLPRRLAML
jgi:hypothetical protein